MIDIVGFSSWCSDHIPHVIAKSMREYNSLLCKIMSMYPSLKKIELVGDCCMIISQQSDVNYKYCCLDAIRFAVDIVEDLHSIRNIFKSKYIGIRIGVHLSDVIGVYIENPDKYQLFGNDINICSRLESSAKPNTIHISEKTLMCVQDICKSICGPCRKCVKGECIKQSYKGVGMKTSYIYYMKTNQVLLLNFDHKSFCHFNNMFDTKISVSFDSSSKISMSNYESFKYICVFISLFREKDYNDMTEILNRIIDIDKDKANSGIPNQITTVVCKNSEHVQYVKNTYPYHFDHVLNILDGDYKTTCEMICNLGNELFEEKRGSLDLHID